jgi:protein KTI12
MSFISLSPGSLIFRIPARDPFFRPLELHLPQGRQLTLSEMQRLKRQFETMQRKALSHGGAAGVQGAWTEQSVAEAFIRFLERTWGEQ